MPLGSVLLLGVLSCTFSLGVYWGWGALLWRLVCLGFAFVPASLAAQPGEAVFSLGALGLLSGSDEWPRLLCLACVPASLGCGLNQACVMPSQRLAASSTVEQSCSVGWAPALRLRQCGHVLLGVHACLPCVHARACL